MQQKPTMVLIAVAFALSIAGCSSDKSTDNGSGGGGGQEVRFELTPIRASSGALAAERPTLIVNYLIHCIDQTDPNCITLVYEDEPHVSGNFMSYPQDHSSCISFFAIHKEGIITYNFTGTIQRPFGTGTGPFVTGNYDWFDGTNFGAGTFEFYEQTLSESTSAICAE
jgi:hypothetical protein